MLKSDRVNSLHRNHTWLYPPLFHRPQSQTARAATQAVTDSAPARFSDMVHSLRVVPVVMTSSTIATCFRLCRRQSNAPLTFFLLCEESRPNWARVLRIRVNKVCCTGISRGLLSCSASICAWLNVLLNRRLQCRGTGTIASGNGPLLL